MEAELVPIGSASCQWFSSQDKFTDDKGVSTGNALLISLCPSGKVLNLVMPDCKAHFLTHDENDSSLQDIKTYHNSFQGLLDVPRDFMASKERPTATALTTVPIAFMRDDKIQQASIALVGFSDGYIRGYSKSGHPVLSEQLHLDPVSKISSMLPSPTLTKECTHQGNIVVLTGSVVCVIEGWSLVQLVQNNVAKMNTGIGWSEHDDDSIHLVYRKWHLKEQVNCFDVALLGHTTPSVYDYLCEASSVIGFEASIRSGPIPEAKLISVGENPIIALYKLSKDAGQVNMSEVVHAVASKMKSAVLGRISQAGGWLGWGSQKQQKQQESLTKSKMVDDTLYRSSDLPMEVSIPDNRRSVLSIVVSPLGNLAAVVDSFGRVMLLDCESLVVRKMWKGYRDAQCGWLLASEAPSRSLKLKGKQSQPQSATKTAQCLCIYAAQRGILELWPAVYSRRVGAFYVGKGCRLLYSHTGVFTTSEVTDKYSKTPSSRSTSERVRNTTVILTPPGNLVTVSIPFPLLLRSDDPASCNAYLMKKFLQVVKIGDIKEIFQLVSEIKSTKLLKQAVETLIKLHPVPNSPRFFLSNIISNLLKRMNPSNPDCELLYRYLLGCQQLIQLKLKLKELQSSSTPSGPVQFSELLQEMLAIRHDLAQYIASMLSKYYTDFIPPKKVVKELDMNGLIQNFDLPCEVGDHLLEEFTPSEEQVNPATVKLLLKDETDTNLLDLGNTLFLPILESCKIDEDVRLLLEKSGIPKRTLLLLLSHVFLNGKYRDEDLSNTHQNLYNAFSAVLEMKDNEDIQNLWMPVCRQCALTSNVGHAFSIALIHQKMCTDIENLASFSEEGGVMEDWESVSAERGHWATLYSNLEVLLHLCNLVGLEELRKLPSIPFDDWPDDPNHNYAVDVTNLNLKFYDKVYRNSCMCAASLKNAGPCLVSHCLCAWITKMGYSPEFVKEISVGGNKTETGVPSRVLDQLVQLLKMLPFSLDGKHLLIHCAWQAAYAANEFGLSLQYMTEITDHQTLAGLFGLLWCLKFENIIVKSIENYKRGISLDKESVMLISVCRIMFGYMFQFTEEVSEGKHQKKDVSMCRSQNRINLMEIAELFPSLNIPVTRTCLELLITFEIALQLKGSPINLMALFPNWLRSSLKKGIYKSSWQEQVPVQLRQKRSKFLMETVSVCLQNRSQPLMSNLHHKVVTTSSTQETCIEFQDFVFTLGKLWKLDIDEIKNYWIVSLFADGLVNQGKSIFLTISDKTIILSELLSLAGYLTDQLLHQTEEKPSKLAMLAQIPPTLLEWMRKQSSNTAVKRCSRTQLSWKTVSQLVTLTIPYFSEDHNGKDKAVQLDKIIKLNC